MNRCPGCGMSLDVGTRICLPCWKWLPPQIAQAVSATRRRVHGVCPSERDRIRYAAAVEAMHAWFAERRGAS